MEEEAPWARQVAEAFVDVGHLVDFQIDRLGVQPLVRGDPFRPQEDNRAVVLVLPQVDARAEQRFDQRVSRRQDGAEFGLDFRAGEHFRPGQAEGCPAVRGGQRLLDAAIELVELIGAPLEPSGAMLVAVEEGRPGGEAVRPVAGDLQRGVALEAGDRAVVHAPVGPGQLGIPAGGQPQGQPGKRAVLRVAIGKLPHHPSIASCTRGSKVL